MRMLGCKVWIEVKVMREVGIVLILFIFVLLIFLVNINIFVIEKKSVFFLVLRVY